MFSDEQPLTILQILQAPKGKKYSSKVRALSCEHTDTDDAERLFLDKLVYYLAVSPMSFESTPFAAFVKRILTQRDYKCGSQLLSN